MKSSHPHVPLLEILRLGGTQQPEPQTGSMAYTGVLAYAARATTARANHFIPIGKIKRTEYADYRVRYVQSKNKGDAVNTCGGRGGGDRTGRAGAYYFPLVTCVEKIKAPRFGRAKMRIS